MRKVLLIVLMTVFQYSVKAQQINPCATEHYEQEMLKNIPAMQIAKDRFLDEISRAVTETDKSYKKGTVRIIPVVFHVIHMYGDENISKEQIDDQMRVLNEDYRRVNPDTSNTRSLFKARAVDSEVEFKLARKDPQGNCTDGITRTYSTATDGGDDEVKNIIRWDYRKYLNIWVIKKIGRDPGDGTTILGYATLPYQTSSTQDGIVMISSRVGTIGTSSKSNAGRTLTHEVGHWLGLLHPFQDECGGPCNSTGDRICDTPPVLSPSFGCNKNNNTCSNDLPDELDMVENFMDYANGNCQNAFTAGQKAVMNQVFANNNYRAQNISSATASATGISTNPTCGPKADFHTVTRRTVVCEGKPLVFEDLSYNGIVTDRTWIFEGGSPSFSTFANPSVTYSKAGTYKVSLESSNSGGKNSVTKEAFITVLPALSPFKAPYSESFELANVFANDWFVVDEGTYIWKRNSTVSYTGTSCLQAVISSATPTNLRINIYSPVIDISVLGISSPTLSFRCAYSIADATKSELLVIHGSIDCGETWKPIKSYRSNTGLTSIDGANVNWKPTAPNHWKVQKADLVEYKSATNLMLRFEAISQAGNSIFIEDINIDRYGVGIPNVIDESEFSVFPVPSSGELFVKFNFSQTTNVLLNMTDITGKIVYTREYKSLANGNSEMALPSLPEGVYFLRAKAGEFVGVRKILIIKN